MRAQLRSELIKLRTTHAIYGLSAGAWALVALATWSTITQIGADNLSGDLTDQHFFYINAVNLTVFAAVLGARSASEEFRYGTVVGAMLSTRHRVLVIAAKSVITTLSGALLAVAAQALMTGLALLLTPTHGLRPNAGDFAAMGGIVAATGFWGFLGTAVGFAVRHQVAAIIGVVVWILVVENLGAALIGPAGRYLPGQAAFSLAGGPDVLPVTAGASMLVVYAAALLSIAGMSLIRRDL